ncbi:Polynucleotide 5'-hydroxyl-kinase grc3 [Exophiala dermatitidis]|uniref:Polynucleotide 5'-hydroxyl-kinase GRC3 n=1 Tax=Exophiala dermatitidis (strain ATCC 34100 / CBS 525.76 / NIH/UT8656) TaxID=858893 RepID=H6C279_EXODN|nr:uncharacterized protein HMPREF1120_06715 [Exophiala dermatitidis NIH/UT8656]KAJ4508494.1 Polynucleotide 5'-hydroxyl-kinase grc3 [Exophiala dermatitidis]EHY58711.1 hypothetical protein HMPREF1120_06715 [Exophiala dermatitidis NIH/UT8656]KAJ4510656.1 Polynucleotide 5'-hydroxyl-kinase grc3 [Exophiala dermatitidis]KAJ4545528.1 Polynucleotide 5'-hydroxyl-kinase grc3 [Exophiala dermatitidis]KAJ4575800.1 Polynucleotide 5'-hydroxyl-kinase grc3 [Exophiala dermatitidis]
MTANGERLSAVARRRLLRDAQAAAPISSSSAPPAPAPAPTAPVEVKSAQRVTRARAHQIKGNDSSNASVDSSNPFSALVTASAVKFSATKEVQQLSETSAKIRLSRGQRCVILGICILWVRQGSVSVYGATIHASTAIYRIYAPSTHALPAVEALSSKAEFQLDSYVDGLVDLPSLGIRHLWATPNVEQSMSSFYILGHSFDNEAKGLKRLREMSLENWHPIISTFLSSESVLSSQLKVLFCGRRSSGISTLARCLLNGILTTKKLPAGQAGPEGVLFIDLDTKSPEFGPPGTINLAHVTQPMLGPSFTQILSTAGSSSRILRSHFLGDSQYTDLFDWHWDRIVDLFDQVSKYCTQHRGTPVIILAPKWWHNVDQQMASQLWSNMALTDIVCLDTSPTSPYLQPWKSFAEAAQCRIHQIPAQVFDKVHSSREHDLQMQSYFHLVDWSLERPLWNDMPILAGTYRETRLTYGTSDADVGAVILLGGHVALEDTYDALEGNLVAVVAVERRRSTRLTVTQEDAEDDTGPMIQFTDEGLPRVQSGMDSLLPILGAQHSFCVAIAMVARIDIPTRHITLVNGHGLQDIKALMQGYQVALVLQMATSDGRFTTDWLRKELKTGAGQPSNADMTVS